MVILSFCGNGMFLLLLTDLRNLHNKQGILSKFFKLTHLSSRPHIASYCTMQLNELLQRQSCSKRAGKVDLVGVVLLDFRMGFSDKKVGVGSKSEYCLKMLMSGQDDKVKSKWSWVPPKCLRSKSKEQYPSPRKCLSYTARKRKSLGFILGTISFLACVAGGWINLCTKENCIYG